MSSFRPLREAVEDLATEALVPNFSELEQRVVRRRRRRHLTVASAVAAVLLVAAPLVARDLGTRHVEPAAPTHPVTGSVPVWYDSEGLHLGNHVEPTAVPLVQTVNHETWGALALVRSGAVYVDPPSGDIWYQPWYGDPRVIGHGSETGPAGDPDGDLAAWFVGGQLVVYDTAAGREVGRRTVSPPARNCNYLCGDHIPSGNTFLDVSPERVVWNTGPGSYTFAYDVATGGTTSLRGTVDVFGRSTARWDAKSVQLLVAAPGHPATPVTLEFKARFSPSGRYVLLPTNSENRHVATVFGFQANTFWSIPVSGYPWIAWGYGDMAVVQVKDRLLACDAAKRACAALPASDQVLLPTS